MCATSSQQHQTLSKSAAQASARLLGAASESGRLAYLRLCCPAGAGGLLVQQQSISGCWTGLQPRCSASRVSYTSRQVCRTCSLGVRLQISDPCTASLQVLLDLTSAQAAELHQLEPHQLSRLRAAAHLELAGVHQHHRHGSKAKEQLDQAAAQLGTSLSVTGKLNLFFKPVAS